MKATNMHDRKTPEQYLREPYARTLIPDADGGFTAQIEEFPGCIAEGETPTEAYQNLEAAALWWLEAALDQNQDIPEPFANRAYSGNIALRLPQFLHALVARAAERERTSVNQFLVAAISEKIGATTQMHKMSERLTTFNRSIQIGVSDIPTVIVVSDSHGTDTMKMRLRKNASVVSDEITSKVLEDAFMHKQTSQGAGRHGR